jgi:phosphoglucosamine mutase
LLCLDRAATGDAIVAALQILEEMVVSSVPLHALKTGMKKFPHRIVNVPVARRVDLSQVAAVEAARQSAQAILGSSGRIILRASGTELLFRVTVEGEDAAAVDQCATALAEVVRQAAL